MSTGCDERRDSSLTGGGGFMERMMRAPCCVASLC